MKYTDTWITPRHIVEALGHFDVDPCCPEVMPWPTADVMYTKKDDGLASLWYGRVWLNPPYNDIRPWMEQMGEHNNGIALVNAKTETDWFQSFVFPNADSILFLKGRLTFLNSEGLSARKNNPAPSVLIGYNDLNSQALAESRLKGFHMSLSPEIFVVGISHNKTWRVIVGEAMEQLDGKAGLEKIYSAVISIAPDKIKNNNHVKAKIRQTLGRYFTRISKATYAA